MEGTTDKPTVIVTLDEIARVMGGSTMSVSTVDGSQQVLLRLATVDEFLDTVRRGHKWFEDNGLDHPPLPTRAQVQRLVTPVDLERLGRMAAGR